MQERLKVYEEKMNKSYDALLNEYTSIRAGRANPHVLDKIKVDYYFYVALLIVKSSDHIMHCQTNQD